jgi:hypothetical protein
MFVGIGHRAGRMSDDGVTHPRINSSALERMPLTAVELDLRMIDPDRSHFASLSAAFTASPWGFWEDLAGR